MAGDWIKLEKATVDKPEIAILAKALQVSHGEAFLSVVRVFIWADGNVSDGVVPYLSPADVDTLSRALPGTCEALASPSIGWLSVRDNAVHFSNWDRHNGASAKQRALDNEKKRRSRTRPPKRPPKCPPICPDANGTNQGPEKRREEKKEEYKEEPPNPLEGGTGSSDDSPDVRPDSKPKRPKRPSRAAAPKRPSFDPSLVPIPERLRVPAFLDAWRDWIAARREKRRPLTKRAVDEQLKQLAEVGSDAAVKAIRKSIANDWQGLFPKQAGPAGKPTMTLATTKAFVEKGTR